MSLPSGDSRDYPPLAPTSRLWWAVPSVGVVLLALVAMLFGGGPEKVAHATSYDASGRGFRATYLILEELGYPVERSRRSIGGELRWILFPSKVSQRDVDELDAWVKRGGVVLLALGDSTLASQLGMRVSVAEPVNLEGLTNLQPGQIRTAEAPDVTQLASGPTEVIGPPGGLPWGRIDESPLVTVHPRGRGQIWLLHRPDVLMNANLRQADNAILACRLAEAMLEERPGGRLAFDEYCHGLRDRPDVAELLVRPPVLGVTIQILVLAALALWHFGVRFGPLRTVPPPPRRSKEEFLDALAELLTRKGDQTEAFRTVRDDLLHRLETELGLPAGTPIEETVREAARRRGVDPDSLARMLTSPAPPQGRGTTAFLAALRQLDTTAHECLQSRHRAR